MASTPQTTIVIRKDVKKKKKGGMSGERVGLGGKIGGSLGGAAV